MRQAEVQSRKSVMIDEVVGVDLHGSRLDRAVAVVGGVTRSVATKLVDSGAVLVNGEIVTLRTKRLFAQQQLSIKVTEKFSTAKLVADSAVEFTVVHDDDDVIVIDKPSGLVVHPGAGHPDKTLVNGLLARYPEISAVGEPFRPGIVHRLDRDTSGLMVIARSVHAYRHLTAQLHSRGPKRVYTALVLGSLEADSGVIEAPIGRSNKNPTRMAVQRKGKSAVTHYRVCCRYTDPLSATLLSCRLETGRTHQIRVHLQAINHPVLGDDTYSSSRYDDNSAPTTELGLHRPFLHAAALTFRHPVSEQQVHFESELPEDLKEILSRLQTP